MPKRQKTYRIVYRHRSSKSDQTHSITAESMIHAAYEFGLSWKNAEPPELLEIRSFQLLEKKKKTEETEVWVTEKRKGSSKFKVVSKRKKDGK